MHDLDQIAASAGIIVVECQLPVRGCWDEEQRVAYLDRRLCQRQRVTTLAHELGHAHYHDAHLEHLTPRARAGVEDRATRWGARLAIDLVEYQAAEQLLGGSHAGAIARELGCTAELVEAWQAWVEDGTSRQQDRRYAPLS